METEVSIEVWRPIADYEGLYEVSNLGRVRSVDRHVPQANGTKFVRGRTLRPAMNNNGYLQVLLCKNGLVKHLLVHRLVAAAFCEQPEGCDIVNHKDNNPGNCEASNLEYTTHKGNTLHAILENRIVSRAVLRSDGKYYPILSMVKEDGFWPSAVIKCCNGEQELHKGYGWNYACILENGQYGRVRRFRLVPESCAVQNVQSDKDVKKLKKSANQIRLPEIGMQAVFVPTIHRTVEKTEPVPPERGRVTFINHKHSIFVVEYTARMGKIRETFQFVDIGSRVRLYPA